MEVPELGVQMELQLPAYTTGTAIPDPQPIEWGQGDQTHILMDTSHILNPRGTMGTPGISLNLKLFPFAFQISFTSTISTDFLTSCEVKDAF